MRSCLVSGTVTLFERNESWMVWVESIQSALHWYVNQGPIVEVVARLYQPQIGIKRQLAFS